MSVHSPAKAVDVNEVGSLIDRLHQAANDDTTSLVNLTSPQEAKKPVVLASNEVTPDVLTAVQFVGPNLFQTEASIGDQMSGRDTRRGANLIASLPAASQRPDVVIPSLTPAALEQNLALLHDKLTNYWTIFLGSPDYEGVTRILNSMNQSDRAKIETMYQARFNNPLRTDLLTHLKPGERFATTEAILNRRDGELNLAGSVNVALTIMKEDRPRGLQILTRALGVLNSDQIAKLSDEFKRDYGKTLQEAIDGINVNGVTDKHKAILNILMTGVNNIKAPQIEQMARWAVEARSLEMFTSVIGGDLSESLQARANLNADAGFVASVRNAFKMPNSHVVRAARVERMNPIAQDYLREGNISLATILTANRSAILPYFHNPENTDLAFSNATARDRRLYVEGRALANVAAESLTPPQKEARDFYNLIERTIAAQTSGNRSIVLRDLLLFGSKTLISGIAELHTEKTLGIFDGGHKMHDILARVENMSEQEWRLLKNPAYFQEFANSLKTYLNADEQARVLELATAKINAPRLDNAPGPQSFTDSKYVSRSIDQYLADFNQAGSGEFKGLIERIIYMNGTDAAKYKNDAQFRGRIDQALTGYVNAVSPMAAGFARHLLNQIAETGRPLSLNEGALPNPLDQFIREQFTRRETMSTDMDPVARAKADLANILRVEELMKDPDLFARMQRVNEATAKGDMTGIDQRDQMIYSALSFALTTTYGIGFNGGGSLNHLLTTGRGESFPGPKFRLAEAAGLALSVRYADYAKYPAADLAQIRKHMSAAQQQILDSVIAQDGNMRLVDRLRALVVDGGQMSDFKADLAKLSALEQARLKDEYTQKFGGNLDQDLLESIAKRQGYNAQQKEVLKNIIAQNGQDTLADRARLMVLSDGKIKFKEIQEELKKLTPEQADQLRAEYRQKYGTEFNADVVSSVARAESMDEQKAKVLRYIVENNGAPLLVDRLRNFVLGERVHFSSFQEELRNLSPDQRQALKIQYQERYAGNLDLDFLGKVEPGHRDQYARYLNVEAGSGNAEQEFLRRILKFEELSVRDGSTLQMMRALQINESVLKQFNANFQSLPQPVREALAEYFSKSYQSNLESNERNAHFVANVLLTTATLALGLGLTFATGGISLAALITVAGSRQAAIYAVSGAVSGALAKPGIIASIQAGTFDYSEANLRSLGLMGALEGALIVPIGSIGGHTIKAAAGSAVARDVAEETVVTRGVIAGTAEVIDNTVRRAITQAEEATIGYNAAMASLKSLMDNSAQIGSMSAGTIQDVSRAINALKAVAANPNVEEAVARQAIAKIEEATVVLRELAGNNILREQSETAVQAAVASLKELGETRLGTLARETADRISVSLEREIAERATEARLVLQAATQASEASAAYDVAISAIRNLVDSPNIQHALASKSIQDMSSAINALKALAANPRVEQAVAQRAIAQIEAATETLRVLAKNATLTEECEAAIKAAAGTLRDLAEGRVSTLAEQTAQRIEQALAEDIVLRQKLVVAEATANSSFESALTALRAITQQNVLTSSPALTAQSIDDMTKAVLALKEIAINPNIDVAVARQAVEKIEEATIALRNLVKNTASADQAEIAVRAAGQALKEIGEARANVVVNEAFERVVSELEGAIAQRVAEVSRLAQTVREVTSTFDNALSGLKSLGNNPAPTAVTEAIHNMSASVSALKAIAGNPKVDEAVARNAVRQIEAASEALRALARNAAFTEEAEAAMKTIAISLREITEPRVLELSKLAAEGIEKSLASDLIERQTLIIFEESARVNLQHATQTIKTLGVNPDPALVTEAIQDVTNAINSLRNIAVNSSVKEQAARDAVAQIEAATKALREIASNPLFAEESQSAVRAAVATLREIGETRVNVLAREAAERITLELEGEIAARVAEARLIEQSVKDATTSYDTAMAAIKALSDNPAQVAAVEAVENISGAISALKALALNPKVDDAIVQRAISQIEATTEALRVLAKNSLFTEQSETAMKAAAQALREIGEARAPLTPMAQLSAQRIETALAADLLERQSFVLIEARATNDLRLAINAVKSLGENPTQAVALEAIQEVTNSINALKNIAFNSMTKEQSVRDAIAQIEAATIALRELAKNPALAQESQAAVRAAVATLKEIGETRVNVLAREAAERITQELDAEIAARAAEARVIESSVRDAFTTFDNAVAAVRSLSDKSTSASATQAVQSINGAITALKAVARNPKVNEAQARNAIAQIEQAAKALRELAKNPALAEESQAAVRAAAASLREIDGPVGVLARETAERIVNELDAEVAQRLAIIESRALAERQMLASIESGAIQGHEAAMAAIRALGDNPTPALASRALMDISDSITALKALIAHPNVSEAVARQAINNIDEATRALSALARNSALADQSEAVLKAMAASLKGTGDTRFSSLIEQTVNRIGRELEELALIRSEAALAKRAIAESIEQAGKATREMDNALIAIRGIADDTTQAAAKKSIDDVGVAINALKEAATNPNLSKEASERLITRIEEATTALRTLAKKPAFTQDAEAAVSAAVNMLKELGETRVGTFAREAAERIGSALEREMAERATTAVAERAAAEAMEAATKATNQIDDAIRALKSLGDDASEAVVKSNLDDLAKGLKSLRDAGLNPNLAREASEQIIKKIDEAAEALRLLAAKPNLARGLRTQIDEMLQGGSATLRQLAQRQGLREVAEQGLTRLEVILAGLAVRTAIIVAAEDLTAPVIQDVVPEVRPRLKPSQAFLDLAVVRKGEGPWQSAERILAADGKKHTVAEVRALTTAIQAVYKVDNNGNSDMSGLRVKYTFITEGNFDELVGVVKDANIRNLLLSYAYN